MKLMVAIVQDQDVHGLRDALIHHDFRMTKLSSTGGFLKTGNTTLLIGLEDERVQEALDLIEKNCQARQVTTTLMTPTIPGDAYIPFPMEVVIGGATVFILDVEQFIRF